MSEKRLLIIDSDTGVDDAMAILMAVEAHKRGQVEIIAITAVCGNTGEQNAERNILRTLGNPSSSSQHFGPSNLFKTLLGLRTSRCTAGRGGHWWWSTTTRSSTTARTASMM